MRSDFAIVQRGAVDPASHLIACDDIAHQSRSPIIRELFKPGPLRIAPFDDITRRVKPCILRQPYSDDASVRIYREPLCVVISPTLVKVGFLLATVIPRLVLLSVVSSLRPRLSSAFTSANPSSSVIPRRNPRSQWSGYWPRHPLVPRGQWFRSNKRRRHCCPHHRQIFVKKDFGSTLFFSVIELPDDSLNSTQISLKEGKTYTWSVKSENGLTTLRVTGHDGVEISSTSAQTDKILGVGFAATVRNKGNEIDMTITYE